MLDKQTGVALYHVKFLFHKREERSVREMVARGGADRDGSVPHIRFRIELEKGAHQ